MPTVLRFRGFRFFFYSLDRGEPPHVHAAHDDRVARFWSQPVRVARSDGFRDHELVELRLLVVNYAASFLEAWHEHFGNPGQL